MASKFHKNAILTGYVDSFCLVCECLLKTEPAALMHIDKPVHQKNLERCSYHEKFKGDRIRKVKLGYYCEFCNVIFSILSQVKLHVAEESHIQNKGSLLLKHVGGAVVAYDNVIINARSWQGIIDNTCVVCNVEFENESLHTSSNIHYLNSVQKPVTFGPNNAIYRHIDDSTIQCLTCETVISSNKMIQHFNHSEHISFYEKCREENKSAVVNSSDQLKSGEFILVLNDSQVNNTEAIKENIITDDTHMKDVKTTTIDVKSTPIKIKSTIIDSINKYQKNYININLETEAVYCKKCLVSIKFDNNAIENHIENHASSNKNLNSNLLYPSAVDRELNKVDIRQCVKNAPVEESIPKKVLAIAFEDPTYQNDDDLDATDTETSELPEIGRKGVSANGLDTQSTNKDQSKLNDTVVDPAEFAKNNYLTYNKDNRKTYCRICEKKLTSSLNNMKEHVAGATHKKNVQIVSKPKPILKTRFENFIDTVTVFRSIVSQDRVMINNKYCISWLSFSLITKTATSTLRCQACEEMVMPFDTEGLAHVRSSRHEYAVKATHVVTSDRSEFIREVRAGLYHCGFCNLVVGDWPQMDVHLQCSEHKLQKQVAGSNLTLLRQLEARQKKEHEFRFLQCLLMRSRYPF